MLSLFALGSCQGQKEKPPAFGVIFQSTSSQQTSEISSNVDTLTSLVNYLWTIPSKDSSLVWNNYTTLARLSSVHPVRMIELAVDGRIVAGYRSPNVRTMYESEVATWGSQSDFFFSSRITDADFDTGYHLSELTVTDSLGNSNTRRFRVRLVRSLPGSYYAPETIKVIAGWNIISPGKRAARAFLTSTIPPAQLASPFFSYGTKYTIADTLSVTRGYWVKSLSDCMLIMNSHADTLTLSPRARSASPPPPPSSL
jgi:hypothetical protein